MILPLLQRRRSIRRFLDRPVPRKTIDQLLEAALRSPSSRGLNPWQFVVVTERRRLADLARARTHGSSFLADAPLAIVVCADPARSDVWVEDCAIAAIILQLTAQSLGLGSCWVQIRRREHGTGVSSRDYLANILGLPAGIEVEAIIGLGYPGESPAGHPPESLDYPKIHLESFGHS